MDLKTITDKEINVNIMLALMKIEAHLCELVEANAECIYEELGGDVVDNTGLN